jgi:hypothetical protein
LGIFLALSALMAPAGICARSLVAGDDAPPDKPTTSKSSDNSSAAKASASSADQFSVPDGKPPALTTFIAKMRRLMPPKDATEDEKKAFLIKSHTAMLTAVDKIIATNPVGYSRVAALNAKIDALSALKDLGDDGSAK